MLTETCYDSFPAQAVARLGIRQGQKNVLVKVVLRHLERTLTDEEANRMRDRIYMALHRGTSHLGRAIVIHRQDRGLIAPGRPAMAEPYLIGGRDAPWPTRFTCQSA